MTPTAKPGSASSVADIGGALEHSFDALDEPQAQATLDNLFSSVRLELALTEVILPFLHRLGAAVGHLRGERRPGAFRQQRPRRTAARPGPGLGRRASARGPCWPARPASVTNSGCCASASLCASAAGGSPTWGPRRRWPRSPQRSIDAPSIVILAAVEPQRFEDVAAGDPVTVQAGPSRSRRSRGIDRPGRTASASRRLGRRG